MKSWVSDCKPSHSNMHFMIFISEDSGYEKMSYYEELEKQNKQKKTDKHPRILFAKTVGWNQRTGSNNLAKFRKSVPFS